MIRKTRAIKRIVLDLKCEPPIKRLNTGIINVDFCYAKASGECLTRNQLLRNDDR